MSNFYLNKNRKIFHQSKFTSRTHLKKLEQNKIDDFNHLLKDGRIKA